MVKRLDIDPTPPSPDIFFVLPSFILTSRTEDNLPPYSEEIPPFCSSTFFIASLLKTEKKQFNRQSLTSEKKKAESIGSAFPAP